MAQDLRRIAQHAIAGAKQGAIAGGGLGAKQGFTKFAFTGNPGFIPAEAAIGATVGAVSGGAITGGAAAIGALRTSNPTAAKAIGLATAGLTDSGLIDNLSNAAYAAIDNKLNINVRPYIRQGKRVKGYTRTKGGAKNQAPRVARIPK